MAGGAAALLAGSALTGELSRGWSPAEITIRGTASLAFLVVRGTVLGFGAYTWLMRGATPATASSYGFVNPVIALLLGWAAGDEVLSAQTAIAATLVVGSVLLTRRGHVVQDSRKESPKKARPTAAPSKLRIADS